MRFFHFDETESNTEVILIVFALSAYRQLFLKYAKAYKTKATYFNNYHGRK